MRLSCLAMHPVDVNNISMHQPVRPQIKKFCNRLMRGRICRNRGFIRLCEFCLSMIGKIVIIAVGELGQIVHIIEMLYVKAAMISTT